MAKKTYPTTKHIRAKVIYLTQLQELFDILAKPRLFKHVPVDDQLKVIRELAQAKADMTEAVYHQFPEMYGKNFSINQAEVDFEMADEEDKDEA